LYVNVGIDYEIIGRKDVFQYAGLTGYDAVPSQGRIYEAAGISECPQWCGSATARTGGA
jgi:hypothetical protein